MKNNMAKPSVTTTPLKIVRVYEHNGIKIPIEIDFLAQHVSLVEPTSGSVQTNYAPKRWVFAYRGPEYEKGWHNILEAMRICTNFAFIELQQHIDNEREKAAKLAAEAMEKE